MAPLMAWEASAQSCGALGGTGPNYVTSFGFAFFYFNGLNSPSITGNMDGAGGLDYDTGAGNPSAGEFDCQVQGNRAIFRFRTGDVPTAGDKCSFVTTMGGSCNIRGSDGLPVELLELTVE